MQLCRELRYLVWAPQLSVMALSSPNGPGEKIFTLQPRQAGTHALAIVKTAGMAHHPSSKMRRGEHVPSSPFPSNPMSNYAALQVTALFSPWLFSPYGKDPPEKGWPHHANFEQRSVSGSLSGCQLLSARAQALFRLPKKKTGLIYLTFQRIREKKKSLKKGKIEFGNFIPRRVGNGSRALTLRLSPRPQHS